MFEGARSGELVETALPRVTLRNSFAHPYDSAIAAARTCYASRLIVPEEITDKQRLNIGAATFYSGHHTVYQHAPYEQAIARAWNTYRELSLLLVSDARAILSDIWHIGPMSHSKRLQKI